MKRIIGFFIVFALSIGAFASDYDELPAPSSESDFKTLSREAHFGHIPAKYELALLYATGKGVAKDPHKALALFYEAAKHNDLNAEYAVGLYCLNGWVVEKSIPHAMYWLRRAALHGNAKAQLLLGSIYENGIKDERTNQVVEKSPSRAKAMYSLAAQNGLAKAQRRLAEMKE